MKTFDIVSDSISQAEELYKPLHKRDEFKVNVLKQYCSAIDDICDEFTRRDSSAVIDGVSGLVSITVTIVDICIEETNHLLYKLFEKAISVNLASADNGNVIMTFVFPSIWEDLW